MMRLERCSTNALRDGQGVDRSGYHCSVYRAADVDALLASIRAAVVAEREAGAGIQHPYGDCGECDEWHDEARAPLDALLIGSGV